MTTVSNTTLDSDPVVRLLSGASTPSSFGDLAVAKAHRRGWLVRRVLLLADVFGLTAAFLLAELVVPSAGRLGKVGGSEEWLLYLLMLPLWVVAARLYGLYSHDEERTDHSTIDDFGGVFHLVTVGTCVTFFAGSLSGLVDPSRDKMAIFWLAAIALIPLGRALGRLVCRRSAVYLQNTLVVGRGDMAELIARKVQRHPEYGLNLVGVIDEAPENEPVYEESASLPHFSPLAGTPLLARALAVERVIIALPNTERERVVHLVHELREIDVQVDIVPFYSDVLSPSVDVQSIEGLPLLGLRRARLSRSSILLKRTVDMVLSAIGLLVATPLFFLIAVAIRLDSKGPVFFKHTRMGRDDKPFKMFKFRTMENGADQKRDELRHLSKHSNSNGNPYMFKIADDPRVTRVGRILRRYSIDELPQILNVLRGEMSLVGPRPLPLDEDEMVTGWARHRLTVAPGITGLWQVMGRQEIPFEEMVELDYRYVSNWSLSGDIKLILMTIPELIRGSAV